MQTATVVLIAQLCLSMWLRTDKTHSTVYLIFHYVIIFSSEPDCPSLQDADSLSQTQLIKRLTHSCRYDRLERPISKQACSILQNKAYVQ